MTISDETLMAFADGELDDAARAAVELAVRTDPQLEKRVAEHRALRQRLQAAYSAELSEPVPDRLLSAAKRRADVSSRNVVNLQDARDAMAMARDAARARPPNTWWRPAGSIAASLLIGLGLGYGRWHQSSPLTRNAGGAVVASGQLAQGLSQQLAADGSAAAAVQIGISFLAKSGDYCRTFVLSGEISPAGLACRHGQEWQILTLSQSVATGNATASYRTAASEMSPAILKAVQEQISGEPLDANAEAAARSKDWNSAR